MTKIGFLTDSSSDIPQDLAKRYGIEIVGFPISLDGKQYVERENLTNDDFYDLMRASNEYPKTSAITSLQWCDVYCRYVDEGYTDLIHVCINGNGSSTYQNALRAVELLSIQRPGHMLRLRIVDSHSYTMAFGWPLCMCAHRIRAGDDILESVLEMERALAKVEICLSAYSLKQMKKSGRIPAAASVAGDLLGVRPIISLIDGVSRVEAKVRGDANVVPAMVKWVKSHAPNPRNLPYLILYTSSTQRRDELIRACRREFGHAPSFVGQLGCAVSANSGPDCIAIVFEGRSRRLCDYTPSLP